MLSADKSVSVSYSQPKVTQVYMLRSVRLQRLQRLQQYSVHLPTMSRRCLSAVIFDLDGTLTAPGESHA
jgi:hypothetical protein